MLKVKLISLAVAAALLAVPVIPSFASTTGTGTARRVHVLHHRTHSLTATTARHRKLTHTGHRHTALSHVRRGVKSLTARHTVRHNLSTRHSLSRARTSSATVNADAASSDTQIDPNYRPVTIDGIRS